MEFESEYNSLRKFRCQRASVNVGQYRNIQLVSRVDASIADTPKPKSIEQLGAPSLAVRNMLEKLFGKVFVKFSCMIQFPGCLELLLSLRCYLFPTKF